MNSKSRVKMKALDLLHAQYEFDVYKIGKTRDELKIKEAIILLDNIQNDIYDKSFWGLGIMDSICAVAGPISSKVNKLRKHFNF